MQIIQSIRDKGAPITIVAISLALIAFILMDGVREAGGPASTYSIGKMNGTAIEDRVGRR